MAKLTKEQIKVKLESLSSNQQIIQPSEEALDEAFLTLVYDAQTVKYDEDEVGVESSTFNVGKENNSVDAYLLGARDGQITYARWVLESLFGINLDLLKELLS